MTHTPTILGRDDELATLPDNWRVADNDPTRWLITAPPGMGKSRLVDELTARVEAEGGEAWVANASPMVAPRSVSAQT